VGVNGRTRAIRVANPASSWPTRKESPEGRTWTSRWAFETRYRRSRDVP
jgi:hypothetical protein